MSAYRDLIRAVLTFEGLLYVLCGLALLGILLWALTLGIAVQRAYLGL